jgi:hypothetical protein
MIRPLIGLALFALIAPVATAAPPRVLETVPEHGELAADPALAELLITFDQDMTTGRSICGGGDMFPEIAGELRWETPRTLVIPVRLAPAHDYALSVNCSSFRNFRSAAGEEAEIYPIQFRTREAGAPAPAPLAPDDNRRAIAELARLIDEVYSHRDRLGVDWAAVLDEHRDELEACPTQAAFARAAASMLATAEDLHLGLAIGDIRFGTHRREITPNIRPDLIAESLPDLKWLSPSVAAARTSEGFGYIQITTWGAPRDRFEPALRALPDFADAPGVIIDVRPNAGGDELAASEFASRFIHEPAVYSRSRYRDLRSPDGFTAPIDRRVEPPQDGDPYDGPVAVLMGPANMSSCESFLLMMKCAPRATLVGEPSFGSSGNPRPFPLGNGVTAIVPTWVDLAPDGAEIEGRGVQPDITARFPPDSTTDPVLNAARAFLRAGGRDGS